MPAFLDGGQQKGFTDIHHHLIYGMDADGPKTFQDMHDMLKAAQVDGIHKIIATPHVVPGIRPFSMETYLQRIDEARDACRREEIQLTIYPGSEILYTEMTPRYLKEHRIPTMAGTSYVLVEFPPNVSFHAMHRALDELSRHGYNPILAHAERYRCLVMHLHRTRSLKRHVPIRFQINCSSILDQSPFWVRRFCVASLSEGLIDIVATDAHNVRTRPVAMTSAYRYLKSKYGVKRAQSYTGMEENFILKDAGLL